MPHVHIEPAVRYFDIVVDGVEQSDRDGLQADLFSKEQLKALGVQRIECLDGGDLVIRVFLESSTHATGVRSHLRSEIAAWFSYTDTFSASLGSVGDRLIIDLFREPESAVT